MELGAINRRHGAVVLFESYHEAVLLALTGSHGKTARRWRKLVILLRVTNREIFVFPHAKSAGTLSTRTVLVSADLPQHPSTQSIFRIRCRNTLIP